MSAPLWLKLFSLSALALVLLGLWNHALAADVEEPPYEVLQRFDRFELRSYEATLEVQTQVPGRDRRSLSQGFRLLAGYIFGRNQGSQTIAMTAPVSVQSQESGWTMTFTLPHGMALESSPAPLHSQLSLQERPARELAALRFSGWVWESKTARLEQQLLEQLRAVGLEPSGRPILAQYDPPTQLPFLRRNEILVPVSSGSP